MTTAELLLGGAGAALFFATATDRRPLLRGGVALAGVLGLLAWRASSGWPVLGMLAAAVAALNLFHIALLLLAGRRLRFTAEEEGMLAHGLKGLSAPQARHLLDQGLWIEGRTGEVLTRENQPVTHLFYLASGAAEVTSEGRWIVTTGAPTFLGEITVLDEAGATATATLAGPSRFWCVPARELRLFLRENPAIRIALEHSFIGTLADKLRIANSVITARSVPAA